MRLSARIPGSAFPLQLTPHEAGGDAPPHDAYVLANLDGSVRHPERFSRRFVAAVVAARKDLGEDGLSKIRLHDLRHTHATLLLAAGIPVKVVSERLGHATAMITLGSTPT